MFDNILKELKDEFAGKITEIPGVQNNQVDDIFNIVGSEVTKQVGEQMKGGNISALMNLFSRQPNNSSANALQNALSSGITNQIISKLGLNSSTASSIVNMILPSILDKITNINSQTPDDDDSPLRNLFGGDTSSAIGGLLNKLF